MTPPLGHPRRALIVAPHPDDETIGAYGLMRALRDRGTRIEVVIATDGGASHRNSARWPKARLVRARRRESRRAMRQIGVAAAAVRFLDLEDGAADRAPPVCTRRLAHAAARLRGGDLLVLPSPADDHADHRRIAHILAAVRLPGVRRLAYQVWPAVTRRGRHSRLCIGGAVAFAKAQAIRRYRTQTGAITDDPGGFTMSRRQIAAFSRPFELFRETRR